MFLRTKRPLLGLLNAPVALLLLSSSCREREEGEKEEEGKEEHHTIDDRIIITVVRRLKRVSFRRSLRYYYFMIVWKFPLKIHTTNNTQQKKEYIRIGNQRIHPLCHTALLT